MGNMEQYSKHMKESLRPELFWDVDVNKLDLDIHAGFIITRIMERGTREEARAIWNFYGKEKIKYYLTAARFLSPKTISFFATIFKISRTEFQSSSTQNRVSTWP